MTTYVGDAQVLRALKAGARASLLKNGLHKERLETIRAVRGFPPSCRACHRCALTPAEVRVLRLIAEGNANKEIAVQLSISEETVKGQVRNILSKTREPT